MARFFAENDNNVLARDDIKLEENIGNKIIMIVYNISKVLTHAWNYYLIGIG